MGRICQFIDDNYHRPLKLAEAAKLRHERRAFSRFFRTHMGRTFPAFVNDLRVGRACRLLAETEMGMTEIACLRLPKHLQLQSAVPAAEAELADGVPPRDGPPPLSGRRAGRE